MIVFNDRVINDWQLQDVMILQYECGCAWLEKEQICWCHWHHPLNEVQLEFVWENNG